MRSWARIICPTAGKYRHGRRSIRYFCSTVVTPFTFELIPQVVRSSGITRSSFPSVMDSVGIPGNQTRKQQGATTGTYEVKRESLASFMHCSNPSNPNSRCHQEVRWPDFRSSFIGHQVCRQAQLYVINFLPCKPSPSRGPPPRPGHIFLSSSGWSD